MKTHLRAVAAFLALAVLVPLTLSSTPVHAQQAAATAPRIDGFDVEPSAQLTPGNELAFTLYGTPGGTGSVRVGGSGSSLVLVEVEAGVYEGTYTIARRDQVTASSTATANLRVGNRVATSVLDESLLAGAPARWPGGGASNAVPVIERFQVDPPRELAVGEQLVFTLTGSVHCIASARIEGIKGKIALDEIRPGVYEGAYTVRNRDRIAANAVVTGNLRLGSIERSTVLNQSLVASSSSPQQARRHSGSQTWQQSQQRTAAQRVAAPAPICSNCGVVEAINLVEAKGDGSYLGMIAGGVAGALLGSQVGHGQGTTVAEVIWAARGGFAGNEIEKRMKTSSHYEVMVRLENGGSQMVSYPAQPALRVGSRVLVENGALVAL